MTILTPLSHFPTLSPTHSTQRIIYECITAFQTLHASVEIKGMDKYNPSLVTTVGKIADGLRGLRNAFRIKAEKELKEQEPVQEAKKRALTTASTSNGELSKNKKARH